MKHMMIRIALLLAFYFVTSSVFSQTAGVPANLALVGARIYPSPSATPIENGTVLIRNGEIIKVGSSDKIVIPKSFRIISCKGMVLTAAFWNCHVHFIEPKWDRADTIAAARFDQQMADMLTSHGFAHVFDLAEFDIKQTLRIRNRIKKGDVSGPVIYTTGVPLVPPNGSPFYIEPLKFPEATDPRQTAMHVRQQIDSGADGIKLWTGSPTRHGTVYMPVPIVRPSCRRPIDWAGRFLRIPPTTRVWRSRWKAAWIFLLIRPPTAAGAGARTPSDECSQHTCLLSRR